VGPGVGGNGQAGGGDGQIGGSDGQLGGNSAAAGSGGTSVATGSGGTGTGGSVGTGGNIATGGTAGTTASGKGGVNGIAGTTGGGSAGAGGAAQPITGIDPRWAAWPMPNDTVDVTAGAPNPMVYTVNNDGTVRDNVTGLVWQQTPPSTQYNWAGAKTYCSTLSNLAGRTWRLPTPIELASLIDDSVASPGPTIYATAFPATPAGTYWTSLPAVDQTPASAWGVGFSGGFVDFYTTSMTFYVRCVAVDPNVSTDAGAPPARYTNAGATVYDAGTRLTWQEFPAPTPLTWADATAYCASSVVANLGGTGWRLPTKKELLTLVDFSVGDPGPTVDTTAFTAGADHFWSASPQAGMSSMTWYVDFRLGFPSADLMTNMADVRCVR
jgi:hypothetical protein